MVIKDAPYDYSFVIATRRRKMAKKNSRQEVTMRNNRKTRRDASSLKARLKLLEKKLLARIKPLERGQKRLEKSAKKAMAKIG